MKISITENSDNLDDLCKVVKLELLEFYAVKNNNRHMTFCTHDQYLKEKEHYLYLIKFLISNNDFYQAIHTFLIVGIFWKFSYKPTFSNLITQKYEKVTSDRI